MAIKCLYRFTGFGEYSKFTVFVEEDNWKIEKQLLKDRVVHYRKKIYFNELAVKFEENKLSIWPLKHEEVITWIDTMVLMRRLFLLLFKMGVSTESLSIVMEYPLVFGNHMRTDYLLIYQRLVVVLEFGMFNQDEKRSEERYTKKLQESINYRQIIDNLIKNNVEVTNYVMIYRPEFDRDFNSILDENIKYNNTELMRLAVFLKSNFDSQDQSNALAELNRIGDIE